MRRNYKKHISSDIPEGCVFYVDFSKDIVDVIKGKNPTLTGSFEITDNGVFFENEKYINYTFTSSEAKSIKTIYVEFIPTSFANQYSYIYHFGKLYSNNNYYRDATAITSDKYLWKTTGYSTARNNIDVKVNSITSQNQLYKTATILSGSLQSFYVNGSLVWNINVNDTWNAWNFSEIDFLLGGQLGRRSVRTYIGYVKKVIMFNRELTQQELSEL